MYFFQVVIRADGGIERLSRGGTLLGASAESSYQRGVLKLRPGDLLFLRSDGLADQERRGEDYGEARLLKWLAASRMGGLESLADSLLAELSGFADTARNDDISFVLMRLST